MKATGGQVAELAPLYAALVNPSSVAIVGASEDPTKVTARPLRYLDACSWSGEVYVVNPTRATVAGHKAHTTILQLPVRPDHVFIVTAADLALSVLTDCVELGVPLVSIMADGFVGASPGAQRRAAELRRLVGAGTTRVLGPSALGVVSMPRKLVVTANAAFAEWPYPAGGVFVASQSGSAIGALASRAKDGNIGFHTLVSTGSELDLSLGELCLASVDDPQVTGYALFLENLAHAHHLSAFAHAAADRGKPIVAYKIGRCEAAAELAQSHTGALAGDHVVAEAALRDLGIIPVRTFEALLECQPLARTVGNAPIGVPAPRVAVVSTTGGGGAMMVDCLALAGATPTGPSPATRQKLLGLGVDPGRGVLIDLTLAGTRYDIMKAVVDVLLSAPEFHMVVAVPGSSARFFPEVAVKPIIDSVGGVKPLAAFVMPAAPTALRMLRDGGISAFRTPEACADALVAVARRVPPRIELHQVGGSASTRILDEASSYEVLSSLGVSVAPYQVISTTAVPPEMPVSPPVAVKIHGEGLPHKSDLGGVLLGVVDHDGLLAAIDTVVASVRASGRNVPTDRILVQHMITAQAEALIGYRLDPDVGPIVLLSAGGVLAEWMHDRSVRLAPVDAATAQQMIDEIVVFQLLKGYRGRASGDLAALRDAVVAVSCVGEHVELDIAELEINPLLICDNGDGAFAVDAVVRVR